MKTEMAKSERLRDMTLEEKVAKGEMTKLGIVYLRGYEYAAPDWMIDKYREIYSKQ